jgi:excisionase family DNA binding protein
MTDRLETSTVDVEPLLTVAEVAAMLRVSKMTIYRLVHAGDLPALRVSRSFRIPAAAARTLRQV